MVRITKNPKQIGETLDGRKSSYKGGTSSPAVWYWMRKRGDIKNSGISLKKNHFLSGFRANGLDTLAVISVYKTAYNPEYYYEQKI